jgi:galactokinase
MDMVQVSTPSRICLFGEHQDYLGLQVIAAAVNIRFTAAAERREDSMLRIRIRDASLGALGQKNPGLYEDVVLDLSEPLVYTQKRDYFKSIINVLKREGIPVAGASVQMDSEIPIGKGMCSSTTMIMALMGALVALWAPERFDPMEIARMAWQAEVAEFGEPGGMMDHYASALGGLVHLDFSDGVRPQRLDCSLPGCFLLFDSLQDKDTLAVLSASKIPALEGLEALRPHGIRSISDLADDPAQEKLLEELDELHRRKLRANIDNYRIQRRAFAMLVSGQIDERQFGALLTRHQKNLREGLGISTPVIDRILEAAIAHGAYGGKLNGSGGGGCLYCYAPRERAEEILAAVAEMGYPGLLLQQDQGLRTEAG